jgi:hypothetical protein
MRIVPVHHADGLSEFIETPWTVHREDPLWIPPLREQVFYELSNHSAFSRYGRFQLFMCEVDGKVVGRIAALVNPRLTDRSGNVLGQLGYFECVKDVAVARALIDAGQDWLRSQGAHEVLAPMNGGAHRAHRFLTQGFDTAPYLFEPRNPQYYPRFFEQCGFISAYRWFGYELSVQEAAQHVRNLDRLLARRPPLGELRNVEVGRPEEVIHRIHGLLDGCWEGHVGYAPLELEEFAEVFRGGLSITTTGNVSVLVHGDRDLGFGLTYPDYAIDVRALGGRAADWGKWLGVSRPKRLVLHTAAFLPEARHHSGAMAVLAWGLHHAINGGFEDVVIALVVEGFLGKVGKRTREYSLYSRSLS